MLLLVMFKLTYSAETSMEFYVKKKKEIHGENAGEREREKRRECAYAQVHALGPNGKTLQIFFYCPVVKARIFFFFLIFHKSYPAANVLGRSLTLLTSVWDRGLTD